MCNVRLTGVICLLMSVGGSTAFAQIARPERPYRGVFASGVADTGKLLTAEATVSSGYDDDLVAEAAGVGTATPGGTATPRQGTLASLSATLAYSQTSDKFSFGGSATTSSRYYPSVEGDRKNFITGSQGRVGGAAQFSRSTSVSGSASIAYQPFSFGGLFPGLFEPQEGETTLGNLD